VSDAFRARKGSWGVLDTCIDTAMVQSFDNQTQTLHPAHVIPCIPEVASP